MLVRIRNLNKSYYTESKTITRALEEVSLDFKDSGMNFIVGESGSGKSTLLNIIGGLDDFDSGSVVVGNHQLKDMNEKEKDYYRNSLIGFVFQELNLLDEYSVKENIKIALDVNSIENEDLINEIIGRLDITEIKDNNIKDISSGQKQRVAIARSLVKGSKIILCDEPTGALDTKTSKEVMELLKEISKERLIIIITHDKELAKLYGDRIIELKDGKIIKDIEKGSLKDKNIKSLSKNLIEIKKIDEEVVDKINEIRKSYNQKVYISSENKERKVKSLFKEANFIETKEENGFKVVEPLKDKMKKEEIKKSKISLKRLISLAFNNLFNKKKILILTSILMVLSLLLYGVSEGLANYNKVDSYEETINKDDMKNINIIEIKSGDTYERVYGGNLLYLREKYPSINIAQEYLLPLKVDLNKTYNGTKKYVLTGVSEINDVTKQGYNIISGKSFLSNYNEIIISEYFANALLEGEYFSNVNGVDSIINKNITLNSKEYIIVGVIESKYISSLNNEERLDSYLDIRDNLIFVKEGFVNNYINKLNFIDSSLDIFLKEGNISYNKEDLSIANIVFDDYSSNSSLSYTFFEDDKYTLHENEILVSESYLENNDMCSEGCNASSFFDNELVLTYNSNIIYAYSDYTVVGTYSFETSSNSIDNNLYSNSIIVSSSLKEKILENIYYNYQLLIGLSNNDDINKNLINDIYDLGMNINKNFTGSYSKYNEIISNLSDVLNAVSLIMLGMSIVLLYSFIQNSIMLSKRKVGILKSLGVNDKNVFSIFLIETLIVSIVAILGSSVLLLIVSPIINLIVRSKYGFYFSALNINYMIFIRIVLLTFIVSLISLIIPLIKFKKMSTTKLIGSR